MDQIKIGKFISERRKMKKLTQAQLAEMLGITDRAVSKWENGKTMPDSSLMQELCNILDITVNDLLSGEMVSSENYAKELQDKLIEALNGKQTAETALLRLSIVVEIVLSLAFLTVYIYDSYVYTKWSLVVLCIWLAITVLSLILLAKTSRYLGDLRCKKCGTVYLPSAKAWAWAMAFTPKWILMRCPHCKKVTWHQKASHSK